MCIIRDMGYISCASIIYKHSIDRISGSVGWMDLSIEALWTLYCTEPVVMALPHSVEYTTVSGASKASAPAIIVGFTVEPVLLSGTSI